MLNDQTTENSRAVKETFLITVDEQTDKDMKDAVSAFRVTIVPPY